MRLALACSVMCALAPAQGLSYRIVRVDTPVPIVYMPGRRPVVVVHPSKTKPIPAKPKPLNPQTSR